MEAILAIGISVLALALVAVILFLLNFRLSKLSRKFSSLEEISNNKVTSLQENVTGLRTVFENLDKRMINIETNIEGLSRNIESNFQKLFERLPD